MIMKFCAPNSKYIFVLFVPFCGYLFREPSVGVEEFDSDAPVAVNVVNP